MKKRPVNWPLGNSVFVAWEVEEAAGLLVARRNHALVRTGRRLCQGWDLWLDGKFAGALNSRTLGDLATLSREELLRVARAACCGRHREFQPDQPRLPRHPKGGPRPNAGRRPKGEAKRVKINLTLAGQTVELIDARRREIRTRFGAEAMIDEVVDLLKEVEEINTKPLISMIEGARGGLLTFLTALEEKLQRIEVRWRYVTGCRRAAFNAIARAWHHRGRAHQSRRWQSSYLAALCGLGHWSRRIENFSEVERQVSEALDQVVRASSAVECFNSTLRPYVSVKKHLSQGFLALIALYHNTRPLPQRGNKTPLQLAGVDLGDDDWVRLIEHEMRYGQAAAKGI